MATGSTDLLARATAHSQAGQLDEAEALCRELLARAPDDPAVLGLDGVLAFRRGRRAEAIARIERAAALAPETALFPRNLCELYRQVGRIDDAVAAGRRAVALAPNDAEAHYNLGVACYDRLDLDGAIVSASEAIRLKPDLAGAYFERAEARLLRGDLAAGWEDYEWRWKLASAPAHMRKLTQPQWDGTSLGERPLLLIADQGYGDTIQFARYIPQVAARCPNLQLACSPEMRPFLLQQPGIRADHVVWENVPPVAAQITLSGLPRVFRTTLETIPASVPYVRAEPDAAARWRTRLDALLPRGYKRVGLVWAGRPTHDNDRNRSLALAQLAPLGARDRTALIALQKGPAATQIGAWYGSAPLINLSAEIADFTDTAAILDGLDLLVTVDTSVAHLAGAMGKPVWIMLPYAPDWRWLLGRTDSPWYPSVRLFRQPAPGDWTTVIEHVATALAEVPPRPKTA